MITPRELCTQKLNELRELNYERKRRSWIAKAYAIGMSTREIAEEIGISSPQTVANILTKEGVKLRKRGAQARKEDA